MGRPKNIIPCKYTWTTTDFNRWLKDQARIANSSTAIISHELLHKFILPHNIRFDKPKIRIGTKNDKMFKI